MKKKDFKKYQTVLKECTQCGTEFEKKKIAIQSRSYKVKHDRWFCNLTCAALYKNKDHPSRAKRPNQLGNKWGQKWDPYLAWYLTRIRHDRRLHCTFEGNVEDMHDHLKAIWNGRCAISNVPIVRKWRTGKCDETNPFFIASLDRIDSDKPYRVGNVQWISLALNYAKMDAPDDVFHEQFARFLSAANNHEPIPVSKSQPDRFSAFVLGAPDGAGAAELDSAGCVVL